MRAHTRPSERHDGKDLDEVVRRGPQIEAIVHRSMEIGNVPRKAPVIRALGRGGQPALDSLDPTGRSPDEEAPSSSAGPAQYHLWSGTPVPHPRGARHGHFLEPLPESAPSRAPAPRGPVRGYLRAQEPAQADRRPAARVGLGYSSRMWFMAPGRPSRNGKSSKRELERCSSE